MAFLECKNVRIAGIGAGVPKDIVKNEGNAVQSKDYDAADFVETTGVRQRRINPELTTSDLCLPATERLIADLGWEKSEIDGLIFVSQTTDYYLPATACILQDKLGLSRECYAADVVLGCSGWVYGLSLVASLVSGGSMRKVLLLAGDAKRHTESFDPLFGFAGTVTAIEYDEGNKGFNFHFGTDGSGFNAIIIPDGGSRNQVTPQSFEFEEIDGREFNRMQTRMKGMDVFSFGISTAPKSIKKLLAHINRNIDSFDYYIFHQANLMMNEKIRNKLKLPAEKVPYSMPDFGNTSSASIPLTILTELTDKIRDKKTDFLCCGFGVGLSWGTVVLTLDKPILSPLTEV